MNRPTWGRSLLS